MQLAGKEDLVHAAKIISKWEGEIYIHCANGHGRSASVAALVMVLRNQASDLDDAFYRMQQTRNKIHIGSKQRAQLMEAAHMLNISNEML